MARIAGNNLYPVRHSSNNKRAAKLTHVAAPRPPIAHIAEPLGHPHIFNRSVPTMGHHPSSPSWIHPDPWKR